MLTLDGLLFAGLIFVLRVFNYAISTVRTVVTARQQRVISAALAFVEALVFAVVIANIVNDLENLVNLTAYCLGASVGSYVGMVLEARFIVSYASVTIIAGETGHAIAVKLRDAGFGVTEHHGEGRDGAVTILRSTVNNRDVSQVLKLTRAVDADAFITVESARSIDRGWLRSEALFRKQGGAG
jgi:uncharacterized protein YebE (UPF0316 family)